MPLQIIIVKFYHIVFPFKHLLPFLAPDQLGTPIELYPCQTEQRRKVRATEEDNRSGEDITMKAIRKTIGRTGKLASRISEPFRKISAAMVSDAFWFATSLILSLIMGPFTAIPALIAACSCVKYAAMQPEPKAI